MYTMSVAFRSSNRKCLSKYFSLIVFQLIYLLQSILRKWLIGFSKLLQIVIDDISKQDVQSICKYQYTDIGWCLLIWTCNSGYYSIWKLTLFPITNINECQKKHEMRGFWLVLNSTFYFTSREIISYLSLTMRVRTVKSTNNKKVAHMFLFCKNDVIGQIFSN